MADRSPEQIAEGLAPGLAVELLYLASRDGASASRSRSKARVRLRGMGLAWDVRPGRGGRSGPVTWYIDADLGRAVADALKRKAGAE